MFRVPGAFALPVAAASAANAGWDGIVALGVIVRGQTSLFDHLHVLGRAGLSDSTDNKGL